MVHRVVSDVHSPKMLRQRLVQQTNVPAMSLWIGPQFLCYRDSRLFSLNKSNKWVIGNEEIRERVNPILADDKWHRDASVLRPAHCSCHVPFTLFRIYQWQGHDHRREQLDG